MPHDVGSIIRPDPLAFFLTWTTYGSWLPGDARGWVAKRGVQHTANPRLARAMHRLLASPRVSLDARQRLIVEQAVREHCRFRGWTMHAVACRTTHVHAVVSAAQRSPEAVLRSLKARCSRQLSDRLAAQGRWWTMGGSARRVYNTQSLENVVVYVCECQDKDRGDGW